MEKIKLLLTKYFNAETSLQEEELLKNYFRSGNVAAEFEQYRVLFQVFDDEKEQQYPTSNGVQHELKVHRKKRFSVQLISLSGIAATILLAVWLFRSTPANNDYVVLHGKKLNNPELAQEIAQKQMSKVNHILEKSLTPMKSLNKVKKSLEPVKKLSSIIDEADENQK